VRNPVNRPIQVGDRFARTPVGRAVGRALARAARVPRSTVSWHVAHGPWFDNLIGAVELGDGSALCRLERAVPGRDPSQLEVVLEQRLL